MVTLVPRKTGKGVRAKRYLIADPDVLARRVLFRWYNG